MSTLKVLFAVFLSLLFISCQEDEDEAWPQLLLNSDIEEGTNWPAEWVINEVEGEALEFIWTEEEALSGSKSLQIYKDNDENAEEEVWGFWAQVYEGDIPHGKDVELSAMIKGNEIEGQGVAIVMRADREGLSPEDGQFVTTQGNTDIKGTFDWTNYSIVLNDLEPDVHTIFIFLLYTGGTTGEVYFDDVTLSVVE
ncbi:hypothetical protein WJR50_11225 [Catalinimonas sp. 4WD22]|uniref:hypothetical protein n=1 Tax=Catalinimonas locisalis TaxID=3133978 RepID=UPI003100D5FD